MTLPAVAAAALAEHLAPYRQPDPEGLVFPSPEGGLLRQSNCNRRVWRRATRAAGLAGLRFHDLQHTSATLSIAALDELIEAASALAERPPAAPSGTRVARTGQSDKDKKRR